MKIIHLVAISAATAAATTLLFIPLVAAKTAQYEPMPAPVIVRSVKASGPTLKQEEWLASLVKCESRGDPTAINPKDRDGTPSYGLLQFKPSTFSYYAKKYSIEGDLMDPDAQRAIVRRMIGDPSTDWLQQFPDCVRNHIGFPPAM